MERRYPNKENARHEYKYKYITNEKKFNIFAEF